MAEAIRNDLRIYDKVVGSGGPTKPLGQDPKDLVPVASAGSTNKWRERKIGPRSRMCRRLYERSVGSQGCY